MYILQLTSKGFVSSDYDHLRIYNDPSFATRFNKIGTAMKKSVQLKDKYGIIVKVLRYE